MKTVSGLVGVVGLVLVAGCSGTEGGAEDEGRDEGASTQGSAAPAAPSAKLSFKTVKKVSQTTGKDAVDNSPTTCVVDASYLEVSGSKFDREINAILLSGNDKPTSCDVGLTTSWTARSPIVHADYLAVAESGEATLEGTASLSFAARFKNVDVTTGKAVSLAGLVEPSRGREAMLQSLDRQIDALADESGRPLLEADKDVLRDAAKSLLVGSGRRLLSLAEVTDFLIDPEGVRFELTNQLPKVALALDPGTLVVKWSELPLLPAAKERLSKKP